jgi:hypothetical protein
MATANDSSKTRQLLLYFGLMSLLVNLVNPGFLLDIPTSYMLKTFFTRLLPRSPDFDCSLAFPSTWGSSSGWCETFGARLAGATQATSFCSFL